MATHLQILEENCIMVSLQEDNVGMFAIEIKVLK